MALSTSWVNGTTFFAADLNDLTHFTYNRSSSDHLHAGTYAPIFSTADYMPTFSTSDYAPSFSTSDYAITAHLHSTIYAPITGSTVYISGTTTDLGGSMNYGNLEGGASASIYGAISPLNGGSSA